MSKGSYNRTEATAAAPMDMWVGRRIKVARQANGLSCEEVAERVGLSRQFLSRVENGRARLSGGRIYDVACALNVHPGWLFEGSEVMRIPDPGTAIPIAAPSMASELIAIAERIRELPKRQRTLVEHLIDNLSGAVVAAEADTFPVEENEYDNEDV